MSGIRELGAKFRSSHKSGQTLERPLGLGVNYWQCPKSVPAIGETLLHVHEVTGNQRIQVVYSLSL